MKIGQVAQEAGVSVDTVRFYERRGILPAAERRPSGYRIFTAAAVERIRMAKALQELGFTLDEVVDALIAHDQGGATCDSERWRLEAVVDRVDAKIAELTRARQAAVESLQDCQTGRCRLTLGRPATDSPSVPPDWPRHVR
ncbi:MerR family transcriptional regulator [Nonomuraea basaltis]|uniref:MerR family transcriptional regulator n=1 Tax=Nonomuraea basaltis TaxID=2495887 RepID=UPI00110C5FFD|nr:MerR family transcriptional regulator [Nonomuraea basaltis]TMR96290.1 MerR family transcriptional regulator [Nonomuraea basaltis]